MKYSIISQVYTIIMFGTSIFLWIFLPRISIMVETPICLQHPLFMLELLSLLSTAIVWIVTLPIFLYSLVKGKISETRSITRNLFIVSLALVTIVVAISGSIFFSKTIPYRPSQVDDLWVTYVNPPDPFGQVYGFGVLFCEGLWIAWTIFIDGSARLRKRVREQEFSELGKTTYSKQEFSAHYPPRITLNLTHNIFEA